MASPVGLELDLPPRVFEVGRAIRDEPGAVVLASTPGGRSYVGCWPVERVVAFDPEPTLGPRMDERTFGSVPRWVGLLPYDARRDLERPAWRPPDTRPVPHHVEPRWYRYAAMAEIADRVRVVGDDAHAVQRLADRLRKGAPRRAASLSLDGPQEPDSVHADRVRHAIELIRDGHVYQVNLARRFRLRAVGHPVDLCEPILRTAPTAFGVAGDWEGIGVVGSSPELFLALDARGIVRTRPIKGTRPRGHDARADAARAMELDADAKERAELSMVVDVERNDLCRVCATGSVRVVRPPSVEAHGPVLHRASEVEGRLRPGVGRGELLAAMLPSGSVTGAPKIRAMEVIAELEASRRGLYTGAYGVVRRDGTLTLAMAIRTLTVREGEGHYHSGGGIVLDSVVDREVTETYWKAEQMVRRFEPG